MPQNPKVGGQVEIGSLMAGRFTEDDTFYRARILKEVGGGRYNVFYVDYGNY